jgi:predicted  nucleic acid-binding Zn-ribbon protein
MFVLRATALDELRTELNTATETKIVEINTTHEAAINALRSECLDAQTQAVATERSIGEATLRTAREEAASAMDKLKGEHELAVNELNEKMAAIQLELKNIEAMYVFISTRITNWLSTDSFCYDLCVLWCV